MYKMAGKICCEMEELVSFIAQIDEEAAAVWWPRVVFANLLN